MVARRLLVILAVFMGLSVLVASLQPPLRDQGTSTPQAREPATREPEPDVRTVRFSADGRRKRVVVEVGQPLQVEVSASEPTSAQLGVDGPIDAVSPESPARFHVLLDAPVTREIALLDPRRVVGRITAER